MTKNSENDQLLSKDGYVTIPSSNDGAGANSGEDRRLLCKAVKTAALLLAVFLSLAVLTDVICLLFLHKKTPIKIKAFAADAALTEFNFSGNGVNSGELSYNLSLYLVLRNPNNKASLHYDWLQAGVYYRGKRFGWSVLPGFYQAPSSTATEKVGFEGWSAVNLAGGEVAELEREKKEGYVDLEVKICAWIRYWVKSLQTWNHVVIRIDCEMKKIRLGSDTNIEGYRFSGRRCKVD